RSKIEASAIGEGGTRTRGRAEQRLHSPVAGIEVDAGLGVSEACLRHGAPFVLLARFGTWESAPVQWLDRGYTDPRMATCAPSNGDGEARGPSRGADLSIPNLITLGRILLVPVVVWAITAGGVRIAFMLFLPARLTHALAGFLAQRFGLATQPWSLP